MRMSVMVMMTFGFNYDVIEVFPLIVCRISGFLLVCIIMIIDRFCWFILSFIVLGFRGVVTYIQVSINRVHAGVIIMVVTMAMAVMGVLMILVAMVTVKMMRMFVQVRVIDTVTMVMRVNVPIVTMVTIVIK